MTATSARTAEPATKRSGALCSNSAASVQLSASLPKAAEKIFAKPYRALVDLLNVSERDAHYRLSNQRKFTALEVARLLQSEDGIQFLVVLMDKARPRWWKAVLKMGVLGSIEQRRQAELKLMRKVFDADGSSASQFTTSFRAQDPDFFGAVLAGYDELSAPGGVDSAVAPKGARR
jgi:hypothetical protein